MKYAYKIAKNLLIQEVHFYYYTSFAIADVTVISVANIVEFVARDFFL